MVKEGKKLHKLTGAIRRSKSDRLFDLINSVLLSAVLLCIVYPLWFVVIASLSDPNAVNSGNVLFWPVNSTLEGYQKVFAYSKLWHAYGNTIRYLLIGTAINVTLTATGAYALSRKEVIIRRPVMIMITFTMIFSGGLVPTFITVKNLGLYNNMWAMILPSAISAYNLIVARTFFESSLPEELSESAALDGCTDIGFFIKIALPLSPAILAVLVLFYGVAHWNAYFNALIYLKDASLNPLQIELRELLITQQILQSGLDLDASSMAEKQRLGDIMKFAVIIVSSVPIICVYPFLQKYFVKGVMVGAIKG